MKNYLPKILITGAKGQLGSALIHSVLSQNYTLIGRSHGEMDITDLTSLERSIPQLAPDLVINTAAYTAVDKAEQSNKEAMQVNYLGTANLAAVCEKYCIPLVHISTDYIFDGKKTSPYREEEEANPLNVYGKSKWMSEQAVRERCEQHLILRVSAVFSEYRTNFLKTILRLANEKAALHVVNDQLTCPTGASDIAHAIYHLADHIMTKKSGYGTYHYCSDNPVSWYQFAVAIIEEAKKTKPLIVQEVKAIATADYPALAARPAYSVLDCGKIKTVFGLEQPQWEAAMKQSIANL
jgi:dTDP-4-dehydrorhamnose reductase